MIELRPNYEVLRSYLGSPDSGIDVDGLIRTLRRINDTIDDPHYEVGISFFLRPDLSRYIEDIWTMEIEPYLQEYFFDQPTKAETFRWVNVRNDILP
jgi:5-methylcytosine-specific restriction protein B